MPRRSEQGEGCMIWREFEDAVPELARLGRRRFEATRVALLGTLRKDGSPRISPIEPYLVLDHLLLGMLSRSHKALDLMVDPSCEGCSAGQPSSQAPCVS